MNYTSIFVDVPGTVVAGWVGFGIFIALLVGALIMMVMSRDRTMIGAAQFYELALFAATMIVVYLLAACEQFILARDKHDKVNLLMAAVNAGVWLWAVMGTARRSPLRPNETRERYALVMGVISQLLLLLSAFVWDGVIYALWAFAFALMVAAIVHYAWLTVTGWSHAPDYNKHWLLFATVYTILYLVIALLSHLYLSVLSLPGAVWAYLVMHVMAFFWFAACSKVQRMILGPDIEHPKRTDDASLPAAAAASGRSPV